MKCSNTGTVLTNSADILKEARNFYTKLYTPSHAFQTDIEELLTTVRLNIDQAERLMDKPDAQYLHDLIQKAPLGKSPVLDGIPFEVYQYLIDTKKQVFELFQVVINDVLNGVYPDSWLQTRMVLLFKKGDPELLKNWRPLSLINTDAKLFTKLLANRFNVVSTSSFSQSISNRFYAK